MTHPGFARPVLTFLLPLLFVAGCAQPKTADPVAAGPDYGRPLPAGQSALRLVTDPGRMPDIRGAYQNRDAMLTEAMDESLRWFAAPSSRRFFPFDGITHERARASVVAMRELLVESPDEASFSADIMRMFEVYESVGYNDAGIVLFTGYYSPILPASRTPSTRFRHPLYQRPADLSTDPITGAPQGRLTPSGGTEPYPTRREIEEERLLEGAELVWLEDSLSAYMVHVNGSAKLRMDDGSVLYIGYNGKTDRPYASLGKAMIDAGMLRRDEVSLATIRRVYRQQPAAVEQLMYENENYVFFTEYEGGGWPSGSLGVRVTQESSLATDKKIYPRGGVVLVNTKAVTFTEGQRPFLRFMLDQDTGGAIQAPGRSDIFMGVGPGAEILAGGQHAEGRLYYFFLRPEYTAQYAVPVDVAHR